MSGAGTVKRPRYRFCWVCTKQLMGNFHRVARIEGGREVIVHVSCAKREDLEIVDGAHLKNQPQQPEGAP